MRNARISAPSSPKPKLFIISSASCKIKDFYATASNSLVNIHGNIQVLDGIKKDAKTISVAFGEVEKGIASTDDIDTLLMFSKDPLTKLERVLSILQTVQKDIEYVARDVEKRRGNILVDNGGDLSTRYVELRNKIELDSKSYKVLCSFYTIQIIQRYAFYLPINCRYQESFIYFISSFCNIHNVFCCSTYI